MKPFNLEKALAGAPVVTRDGKEVTQLHWFELGAHAYPLFGVIHYESKQIVKSFTKDGEEYTNMDSVNDLFMKTTKKVGYVLAEHITPDHYAFGDWVKVEYEV